jgi:uncharacterized protein DUF3568
MKRTKFFSLLGVCVGALWFAGCVSTVDGHSKGAVPWGKDKIESRYERSPEQVLNGAKEVIKDMGTLTGDNTILKSIEGKVNTRSVWVRVEEIDPKVTQLVVQCRTKGGAADADLASEIDKRVALWLASHP